MQISYYISRLLYENDCVIVPGFGGFVANYYSAKIHPVNHTFYPPSKNILFNSKLTSDDGLLLHSISIGEGISYAEAKENAETNVREWFADLNSGKTIFIENIGKIQKDNEGRLLFDSDSTLNYLESSFGLPTFISPPVQRDTFQKRIEKKFADRKGLPAENKKLKKVLAYSAIVPVLVLIGWFIYTVSPDLNSPQQSSMMTLQEPELNPSVIENQNKPAENPVKPLKDLNFAEARQNLDKPSDSEKIPAIKDEPVVVKTMYYIIGGAFKSRTNAENFLGVLRQKGYRASEAGLNPVGLIMISYFNSEDKSEALVNLEMIKQNENPSAWLLRK
jgi:hypothetical protein